MTRNLVTGEIEARRRRGRARTGGYGNVFYLSTNAELERHGDLARPQARAPPSANPCFTQIHPTCIPVSGDHQSKLTLMSSRSATTAAWVLKKKGDTRPPSQIPDAIATTTSSAATRASATWCRATSRHAPPKPVTTGRGVGDRACRCISISPTPSAPGAETIKAATATCSMMQRSPDGDPYQVPMRIYPAVHYTMGGPVGGHNLMSTLPGPCSCSAKRTSTTAPTARRQRADAGSSLTVTGHPHTIALGYLAGTSPGASR